MSTTTLPTRARTLTSHRGAKVALDELGVAHAAPDHRNARRRAVEAPAAPPEALTLAELPGALVGHVCGCLCRHGNHVVPIVVEADRSWFDVDAAAAIAGVRVALIRPARPYERRRIARPGYRTDCLVWSAE